MKKLIALALLTTGVAFAQNQKEGRPEVNRVDNQVKEMTLDLDLNEKQQATIKAFLEEEVALKAKAREEMHAKKEEQRMKIQEARQKKMERQLAMKQKMKEILTAEQFEKWQTIQAERRNKRLEDQLKGPRPGGSISAEEN